MPHVATAADIEMRLLLEAVYAKYSHDFRDYSGASLKRRVQHALLQFGCETISQLQSKVLHDPVVFQQLLEILTIPFTEMFRDPSYWLALRQQVVPLLRTYPSLKVWVAGCASGEEVFSLAILLVVGAIASNFVGKRLVGGPAEDLEFVVHARAHWFALALLFRHLLAFFFRRRR